uniref:Complex 1 LYR protein domain-containing protein n=1 Tax=Phasianus colchicus TaxID=9054 RepID=A0A669PRY4_PHACC
NARGARTTELRAALTGTQTPAHRHPHKNTPPPRSGPPRPGLGRRHLPPPRARGGPSFNLNPPAPFSFSPSRVAPPGAAQRGPASRGGPERRGRGKGPGREEPPRAGNMAASSRAQVLRLYRALLRESQRFSGYNYRTYAIRRIRDAFRENKSIKDSEKIEELVNKAKENLEIIHRQVTIGQMYATQKLVIESPGNT